MNRLMETARTHPAGMAAAISAMPCRTNDWSSEEARFIARTLIQCGHEAALRQVLAADGVTNRVLNAIELAISSTPVRH